MEEKNYEKSVEAYKNSLKANPKDDDTRYNLAVAQYLMKKQQEQQKQQQQQQKQEQQQQQKQEQKQQQQPKMQQEQAGFFPIMMFGLLGACVAFIQTSKPENRTKIFSIMVAAGFTSFLKSA